MTIQLMEHVGIVVDDLAAATAFFVELSASRAWTLDMLRPSQSVGPSLVPYPPGPQNELRATVLP